MNRSCLIVNFGGPRSKEEIAPFLNELLTDPDVIRTPLTPLLQNLLFKKIAQNRATKVVHDYELIGGRSPIYEDTETLASLVLECKKPLTFHRYLTETHSQFLKTLPEGTTEVLPLFPQFSYTTSGSIARWMQQHVKNPERLLWTASYATHPAYIRAMTQNIKDFLEEKELEEDLVFFLFSAHGLPEKYVREGDPYMRECAASYAHILSQFPKAKGTLAYQSKFGPGKWLRPYTKEVCAHIHKWNEGRTHIVVIPLSFTSDHIETLFEIEYLYLPPLREAGMRAERCPALGRRPDWIEALKEIRISTSKTPNSFLVRA